MGTGAGGDSGPSVLVRVGDSRFLFNCPEGTQRFFAEHTCRLSRLTAVAFTDLSVASIAGLPGLLLTVADTKRALASAAAAKEKEKGKGKGKDKEGDSVGNLDAHGDGITLPKAGKAKAGQAKRDPTGGEPKVSSVYSRCCEDDDPMNFPDPMAPAAPVPWTSQNKRKAPEREGAADSCGTLDGSAIAPMDTSPCPGTHPAMEVGTSTLSFTTTTSSTSTTTTTSATAPEPIPPCLTVLGGPNLPAWLRSLSVTLRRRALVLRVGVALPGGLGAMHADACAALLPVASHWPSGAPERLWSALDRHGASKAYEGGLRCDAAATRPLGHWDYAMERLAREPSPAEAAAAAKGESEIESDVASEQDRKRNKGSEAPGECGAGMKATVKVSKNATTNLLPPGWEVIGESSAVHFGPRKTPAAFGFTLPEQVRVAEVHPGEVAPATHHETLGEWAASLSGGRPEPRSNKWYTSYILHSSDPPKKFDVKRAAAIGLPKGPLFGMLVRGLTLRSPSGRIFRPSDVTLETDRGAAVAIVRCPSVADIGDHAAHPAWRPYVGGADGAARAFAVAVHLCPGGVAEHPAYLAWCVSLGPTVKHIFVDRSLCVGSPFFHAQTLNIVRLHALHPVVFPLPSADWDRADAKLPAAVAETLGQDRARAAVPLLAYRAMPASSAGWIERKIPGFGAVSFADYEARCVARHAAAAAEAAADARAHAVANGGANPGHANPGGVSLSSAIAGVPLPEGDPEFELVLLGTGSAIPSMYRNVSSTWLSLQPFPCDPRPAVAPWTPEDLAVAVASCAGCPGFLFDAGEGTYGQMVRRFGVPGAEMRLLSLRAILVSHMHADHLTGLSRVVLERTRLVRSLPPGTLPPPPLIIVGPPLVHALLSDARDALRIDPNINSNIEPSQDLEWEFVPCEAVLEGAREELTRALGLGHLEAVPVDHTTPVAYGFVLSGDNNNNNNSKNINNGKNFKIVYSGDTRPSELLARRGEGADVLVHEATFEDDLPHEAVARGHSTISEAAGVAAQMRARALILTHFSQRYPKFPSCGDLKEKAAAIGFGFDMMTVQSMGHAMNLGRFHAALTDLYRDPDDLQDDLDEF